ncbi:hydroxymethylbilane synthase [Nonomuraea typhae]|uniref:hydroxymethylbilane synthase n=1 Tax=Nonomuraea typhae TaxID=2603600 RepID=UPI0012F9CE53|nr:hydroxymethylbilane synthase [Nonomuraea typhae]
MRLGTRRSRLAMVQSRWVAERLTVPVELVGITTAGDRTDAPIERIGATGVFTTALREALLCGEVDVVVHSYKDLPTAPMPGIVTAAVPERADPRDALVLRPGRVPEAGARVGTGSPRRAFQVRQAYDVVVAPMRGNVDTRLRKLADGQVDALVLALAGLDRLGLTAPNTQGRAHASGGLDRLGLGLSSAGVLPLDPGIMLPAPAQGALAVECRAGDLRAIDALAPLDHPPTRAAATAERSLLAALQAGCTAPVGALATPGDDGTLTLEAVLADRRVRAAHTGPIEDACRIGRDLAALLLDKEPSR